MFSTREERCANDLWFTRYRLEGVARGLQRLENPYYVENLVDLILKDVASERYQQDCDPVEREFFSRVAQLATKLRDKERQTGVSGNKLDRNTQEEVQLLLNDIHDYLEALGRNGGLPYDLSNLDESADVELEFPQGIPDVEGFNLPGNFSSYE